MYFSLAMIFHPDFFFFFKQNSNKGKDVVLESFMAQKWLKVLYCHLDMSESEACFFQESSAENTHESIMSSNRWSYWGIYMENLSSRLWQPILHMDVPLEYWNIVALMGQWDSHEANIILTTQNGSADIPLRTAHNGSYLKVTHTLKNLMQAFPTGWWACCHARWYCFNCFIDLDPVFVPLPINLCLTFCVLTVSHFENIFY